MIEFNDEKYGRIAIYEPKDVEEIGCYCPEEIEERWQWEFEIVHRNISITASVIAFRDVERKIVRMVKNHFGGLEDSLLEQFILNYSIEEEILDPIESRFEILDL